MLAPTDVLESGSAFALLSRAAVVGILGGAGLVLTTLYSRRGPLIYPVYAAILAALAFVSARYPSLSFSVHFGAVLLGMVVATAISVVAVIKQSALQRQQLRASGRPMAASRGLWWGFPAIALAIVASSAAVAWISF